ncbi:MAG: hypothetical protein PUA74_08220, partial [Clostridiales bacterium]|nr:hypothetical protein [Clostridiales bacterium]
KFKLDASGEVTLPMQTLTAGSYSVTIDAAYKDGRYISPQSFSFSGTDFTGQIQSQKAVSQRVKLHFTDTSGYSPEGATVKISTTFASLEYTLGADGILEADAVFSDKNEKRKMTVTLSGANGNLTWDISGKNFWQLDCSETSEYTLSVTSNIKICMDYQGRRHLVFVYYLKDGEPQFEEVYGEVPTDSVASGAELLALPLGSATFAWKKATAQEKYELLKSLPAVQTFALNKETVETVFKIDVSKTEYYRLKKPIDLIGQTIPLSEVFLMIGDTSILYTTISGQFPSIEIPKLADGQRVIVRPYSTKDISESLKHLGTYCAEWILDDLSPHEKTIQLGFQYSYKFILKDPDGNEHDYAMLKAFDSSTGELLNWNIGSNYYYVKDPLSPTTVFGAWIGNIDNTITSSYSYWDSVSGEKNVARYELDTTVAHTEPIVLTAEYEPIYRISINNGELNTNIKSVKQQADGSYLVRFTQAGAYDYQSLIRLPAGAYDIMLNGENQASGELSLAKGKNTHSISFRISEADLKADNRILCHIITPQGNRSLQFIREIENTVFTYSMPTQVSSNEVMFSKLLTESGSAYLLGHGTTQPAHSIFYYNLGTTFGAYWGLERHIYTDPFSRKTTSTEYDRLDPTKSYYKPDYSAEDYKNAEYTAFSNGSSYKSFECKWVT